MALLLDVIERPYSFQNNPGNRNLGGNKNDFFQLFCFLAKKSCRKRGSKELRHKGFFNLKSAKSCEFLRLQFQMVPVRFKSGGHQMCESSVGDWTLAF